MSGFVIRPLDPTSWAPYADLMERHNGVFGGCWCVGFHAVSKKGRTVAERRDEKRQMVDTGRTHAALVFAGDLCVGWCQFGSPEELPAIKNKKAYHATLTDLPAWRLTCFFVDRHYRKQGVAAAAMQGALDLIAARGGGVVEAYPEDVHGVMVSPTFLHAGTLAMFEAAGFSRQRQIGKNKWVVTKSVQSGD